MEDFIKLNQSFEKFHTFIEVEQGKREILLNQKKEIVSQIDKINQEEKLLNEVIILFQMAADFARNQAKSQIENLVTRCLRFILETDIEFVVEFSEKASLPTATFYVTSEYDGFTVKTRPELARGGGIVDIISLALRIAFSEIHKPRIEGPLIFDEPGKHISNEYIYNLGEFLKECSYTYDRQIIMVTHNPYLSQMSDVTYQVEIKNGISNVQTCFLEEHRESEE